LNSRQINSRSAQGSQYRQIQYEAMQVTYLLSHFTIQNCHSAYTEHIERQMEDETKARFVVLLRVSSTKQGGNGNGISTQRRNINLFLKQQVNPEVIAELVEVISGASPKRPVLEQTLDFCKR